MDVIKNKSVHGSRKIGSKVTKCFYCLSKLYPSRDYPTECDYFNQHRTKDHIIPKALAKKNQEYLKA